MEIISDPKKLQTICKQWHLQGELINLVPTMGYFHKGHQSLMKAGKNKGGKLIVSLFVNPTQFAPGEDLAVYPNDLERDTKIAEQEGVDILFIPQPKTMYHPDHSTWITVDGLDSRFCGVSRPNHFRGVCTVVTKLFMLILPDYAFFGQKDWQQMTIIKRMVADLNIPVTIVDLPIVREEDGLAMSSRNSYLSEKERVQATYINKGLKEAERLFKESNVSCQELEEFLNSYWKKNIHEGKVDYLAFVNPETLEIITDNVDNLLALTAIYVGKTRLLDNMQFSKISLGS